MYRRQAWPENGQVHRLVRTGEGAGLGEARELTAEEINKLQER